MASKENSALILVDIQQDYFPGGAFPLPSMLTAANNANHLLGYFRKTNQTIIHVKHVDPDPAASFLAKRSKGIDIHGLVAPEKDEPVIEKAYPNSFRETELLGMLQKVGISTVVICGAMSNMCIDATARAAFDFGFNVIIVEDACAASDLEFQGASVPANARYLLVSSLLFHDSEVLAQQRSLGKKIDPGKVSCSAHGVAKQIYDCDQNLITDLRWACAINIALELNEELRNGIKPMVVRFWPGTYANLYRSVLEKKVSEPDIIYIHNQSHLSDDGYPIRTWRMPRSRFFCGASIFASDKPQIVCDPAEVSSTKWLSLSELAQNQFINDDSRALIREVLEARLTERTRWGFTHSAWFREATIAPIFGMPVKPKERTD